jgi:hypothetical protein
MKWRLMDIKKAAAWVMEVLDLPTQPKVKPQNMTKNSKAARYLKKLGMKATALYWAYYWESNHLIYVGVFLLKGLDPDEILRDGKLHTEGEKYDFYTVQYRPAH